jgi:hypothetical protein
MTEIEVFSWLFVYKEWDKSIRMPIPDKGFEESFRQYLYRKIKFDVVSNVRDAGFDLSYSTVSSIPLELDAICTKAYHKFIFELKHYEASNIIKEPIFNFLGKVAGVGRALAAGAGCYLVCILSRDIGFRLGCNWIKYIDN